MFNRVVGVIVWSESPGRAGIGRAGWLVGRPAQVGYVDTTCCALVEAAGACVFYQASGFACVMHYWPETPLLPPAAGGQT